MLGMGDVRGEFAIVTARPIIIAGIEKGKNVKSGIAVHGTPKIS